MNDKGQMVFGQFNDSFPPVMDGVANLVRNYAYWLDREYGECYVVTPAYPGYVDREPFPVMRYYSAPLKIYEPYRIGLEMLDINFRLNIKYIPFDLVHTHAPFSSGSIGMHIARRRKIPIIATFHSKFYNDFKQVLKVESFARISTMMVMEFFNRVDQVWTVNNMTAETLREYGYKKDIEIIPNGSDFSLGKLPPEVRSRVAEKYGIGSDEFILLFIGQHIYQKNTMLIIDALSILKRSGLTFRMIFAGTGVAKEEMEKKVSANGLDKEVIFLGSITDREVLGELYSSADLFVFPSVYDNAPLVVREAAAHETPSLLIEGSNASEGIIDGKNGFLTANSAEAVAKKIIEISANPERVKVGIEAGRTIYRSWKDIADEVYHRYNDLVKFYTGKGKKSKRSKDPSIGNE